MKVFLAIILFLIFFRGYFFFLEQRSLYYPEREILITPADFGLSYEEANFKTADGKLLHGWYIPAEGAEVTILYCHGYDLLSICQLCDQEG